MNGKETIQDISIGDVSNVSIICATIERPDSVTRFINSVRKFYQDISIIIGDQSRDQTELAPFYKRNDVKCLRLPFDCGVAYARNECVKAVKTKFILLCDDDFVFTDQTDINIPLQALKNIPKSELSRVLLLIIINRVAKYIFRNVIMKNSCILTKKEKHFVLFQFPI